MPSNINTPLQKDETKNKIHSERYLKINFESSLTIDLTIPS